MNNLSFTAPDEYDRQQLIDKLAEHYSMTIEPSATKTLMFYDTFDWRLFNKSLVLYQRGNRLFLRKPEQETILQSAEITEQPSFAWDLPAGDLKTQLTPIIEMRALLKQAEIHGQTTVYRILNQDQKTVVRFSLGEIQPLSEQNGPMLASRLQLMPVRGYPRHARNLAERLHKLGLSAGEQEDIYFKALAAAGKEPGDYSAKLKLQLDPAMRADEAAKAILRFLLAVMRRNEPYLQQDIDTEFLHDFRVSIRRTRSALNQIKLVFPAETTARFKTDFAAIGKLSNQLRDLDVYLLDEHRYRAMLPPILRDDIPSLFDYLRTKRAAALNEVISGLNTENYARTLQDWEAFLNEAPQDSETAPNAGRPVIDVARERIYKVYRKIVKDGRRILEDAEDEKLHNLRIVCKKLRYLMEFFSSLFPPDEISALIKQLKKLQNNLGDFNDLCVQEDYLINIAAELPQTNHQTGKTLVAIGSLVSALDAERERVKNEFAQTFIAFAAPDNRKQFKKLFS